MADKSKQEPKRCKCWPFACRNCEVQEKFYPSTFEEDAKNAGWHVVERHKPGLCPACHLMFVRASIDSAEATLVELRVLHERLILLNNERGGECGESNEGRGEEVEV